MKETGSGAGVLRPQWPDDWARCSDQRAPRASAGNLVGNQNLRALCATLPASLRGAIEQDQQTQEPEDSV